VWELWERFIHFKAVKMLSLCRRDVPEYLRCGAFYPTLAGDDEEPFQLPVEVSKLDLHLRNDDDLRHLLNTLRFWAVDTPPMALIEYCFSLSTPELSELAVEYGQACLHTVAELRKFKVAENRLCQALCSGNFQIMRYAVGLAETAGAIVWTEQHLGLVFEAGDLDCLTFMLAKVDHLKLRGRQLTNSVQCLNYALDKRPDYAADFNEYCCAGDTNLVAYLLEHGYSWNAETLTLCARSNLAPMIRFLHGRGCTMWGKATVHAACHGNLDLLRYAHENGAPSDYNCLLYATASEQWPCFTYLIEHDCLYKPEIAKMVALHSNSMLQYLAERGYAFDAQNCMLHAMYGRNIETMRYLHNQGACWPWERSGPWGLYSMDVKQECAQTVVEAINNYATEPEFLHFLYQHGCDMVSSCAVFWAANVAQPDALRYLLQQGCPALPPGYPQHRESYEQHPAYAAALQHNAPCIRLLFEYGHTLAFNKWQLRMISDEECRQLLLEADPTTNVFRSLPLKPKPVSSGDEDHFDVYFEPL
jgi:hypothetical protein